MTKEELATERNEVREILEGFSEELSQSNLDKLSRVFCIINGDEKRIAELEKENAKLKLKREALEGQTPWKDIKDKSELIKENAELKKEWQEQVQKATDEGYARTLQTIQLTKATELLRKLVLEVKSYEEVNGFDPCEPVQEAEQFISEVEK